MLDINEWFFINIATATTHLSKYCEPTLYKTALDNLNRVANKNNDPHGRKNYVEPLLVCLRQAFSYIDESISGQKIKKHSQPPVKSDFVRSANNSTSVSEQGKCKVCNGDHTHLFFCKQLPAFIPSGNTSKKLPNNVCTICLNTDTTKSSPQCHNNVQQLPFKCNVTGLHRLICSRCDDHKHEQNWYKSYFNEKDGFKNRKSYRQTLRNRTHNNTVSYKANINSMKLNECFIGVNVLCQSITELVFKL